MNKKEISTEEKNKIKKLYLNESLSIRKISENLNYSTSLISRIIKEEGYYKYVDNNISKLKDNTNIKKGFKIICICKKTQKEFDDYENKSGILVKHLKKEYKDIEIPSKFKRAQHKIKTGYFWHEKYFKITQKELEYKNIKKCKYCSWNTIDLENKSGAYTSHLKNKHNKSIEEYTLEFPDEKKLFKTYFDKKEIKEFIKIKKENGVTCKICGENFKKITNTHLKDKHNITLSEYKAKFGNTVSETTRKKFSENASNYNYVNLFKKERTNIEIAMENIIKKYFDYIPQKRVGNYFYDFYLPENNIFIETDGIYWHGHDRDEKWNVRVIKNIINDFEKSKKVENIFRLIEKKSINLENLNQINSKDSFFNFLNKENFNIKNHKLFNLKEDDIILSKDYCIKHKDYMIKENFDKDILYLMNNFYNPEKYKNFINIKSRNQKVNMLKAVFFESFYNAHKKNSKNLKEIFYDNKTLLKSIQYRMGNNKYEEYFNLNVKNIYKGIEVRTLFNVGILPVNQIEKLYQEFVTNNNIIYDPFAGWGSRLLALEKFIKEKNCMYFANDSNVDLQKGYNYLFDNFFDNFKDKIEINFSDSKKENEKLKNKVDFIFTSPPFYNDEIYTSSQSLYKSKEIWSEELLIPIFLNCFNYLKVNGYMVIDMKDAYLKETESSIRECGFEILEIRPYTMKKTHYAHKRGLGGKKQSFIICKKTRN